MNRLEPSLEQIATDIRNVADALKRGDITIKDATELANLYGKELKAKQLILAERIFLKDVERASRINVPRSPVTMLGESTIEGV